MTLQLQVTVCPRVGILEPVPMLHPKHQMEVAWINGSIVAISPFRLDVPSSSQRVGFGAQTPLVATTFMIKTRQSLSQVMYNAWVINEISHLITFS